MMKNDFSQTTREWQTLLDGTTPGPWEARQDGHDPVWMIGRLDDNPARIAGDGYGPGNARLLAAAPEAVAEVIRLRKALDELAHGAYVMASQYYYMGGKRYDELGSTEQSYCEDLTRILEGGTDE